MFDLYKFIKEIFVSLRRYLILFISLLDIVEAEYIFLTNSVYKKKYQCIVNSNKFLFLPFFSFLSIISLIFKYFSNILVAFF